MKAAIIGCGYTGSSIATLLHKNGIEVTATTRSGAKLEILKKFSHEALVYQGSNQDVLEKIVRDNDAIFLTLAPDSANDYEKTYLLSARNLIEAAKVIDKPRYLLYTSSCSVYAEDQGNSVSEESLLNQNSSAILQKTENTLLELQNLNWKVCILRLSEIYGPRRTLQEKLQKMEGRSFSGDGSRFSNMIHVEDIARAAHFALKNHLEGIYNLTDDDHPIQKDLFEEVCQKYHLEKAIWNPSLPQSHGRNKKVLNQKIKSRGYSFAFPHRII